MRAPPCQVSEAYLESIMALNARLHFAEREELPENDSSLGLLPAETVAGQDVMPHLDRLRNRAVAKVRQFLGDDVFGPPEARTY